MLNKILLFVLPLFACLAIYLNLTWSVTELDSSAMGGYLFITYFKEFQSVQWKIPNVVAVDYVSSLGVDTNNVIVTFVKSLQFFLNQCANILNVVITALNSIIGIFKFVIDCYRTCVKWLIYMVDNNIAYIPN